MRKQVYLFELDSVRNSKAEIERAQKALFEEIILNGNSVVLSFNQLADSRGFLRSLANTDTSEQIIHMFELGHLKVAQYYRRDNTLVRTASQYFQQALSTPDSFHFSTFEGLNLTHDDIHDIHQAITFCDLPLLQQKAPNNTWNYIINVVTMVIAMSQSRFSIAEPIKSHISLHELIMLFLNSRDRLLSSLQVQPEQAASTDKLISAISNNSVHELLSNINGTLPPKSNCRTVWKNHIYEYLKKDTLYTDTCHIADLIIDLLYNYVVESGIKNVCKHYDGEAGISDSFWQDFASRLIMYWRDSQDINNSSCKVHYYQDEKPDLDNWILSSVQLAPWDTADRIIEKIDTIPQSTETSEQNHSEQIKSQKIYLNKRFRKIIGTIGASIFLFVFINTILGWIQGAVEPDFHNILILTILFAFISTIAFGIIGSLISNKIHLADLLDSLNLFKVTIKDIRVTKKQPRGISYYRKSAENENNE
ncbi:MAG: hypothetical protein ACLUO9_05310 [Coprococcus comes]